MLLKWWQALRGDVSPYRMLFSLLGWKCVRPTLCEVVSSVGRIICHDCPQQMSHVSLICMYKAGTCGVNLNLGMIGK
jgi:hypothetical protein